jgi:hypothetical protein
MGSCTYNYNYTDSIEDGTGTGMVGTDDDDAIGCNPSSIHNDRHSAAIDLNKFTGFAIDKTCGDHIIHELHQELREGNQTSLNTILKRRFTK